MSAPRRTATRNPRTPAPAGASGTAQVPAKTPRPAAPKPVSEPKSKFAQSWANLRKTFQDTVAELKKVIWPDRETTRNLTLLVIALSTVLGLLLGGIDFILQGIFRALG
jgi:preprotein translocase subunit SecE